MIATMPYLTEPIVYIPPVSVSKIPGVGFVTKVIEQPDGSFRVNLHTWNDWGLDNGAHQNVRYCTDDYPKNGDYCKPARGECAPEELEG